MGLIINGKQPLPIHFRVDLGGGEAGVAQELLDLPQIRPGRKEMRGKRVPQRMRRCRGGQLQGLAQRSMASWTMRGLRRPPLAPRNSGPSASSGKGQSAM